MKTPYTIFWDLLPTALLAAEARTKANKLIDAIQRLRKIEEGPDGVPGVPAGQTGYLNNNDPYQALRDYVAFFYDGGRIPFWLASAERV